MFEARGSVGQAKVPHGVGSVEIATAVAVAGIAHEVCADAEAGRECEYARNAVVEMPGVDGAEARLG